MNDLQRQECSKKLALQFVKELPFVVGSESLTEARRHLWLAFGRGSPDLFQCSDASIAYAIALSAMSGLYPGGPRPDVWLIPRYNKKAQCLECNWQMSSRGYQRMAADAHYRTRAYVVHEHDKFRVAQGSSPKIVHEPDMNQEGTWNTIRCAYITVIDTKGRMEFAVLRKDQIQKRRDKAQRDNVWTEWPEEQTLKTMHAYAGAREMWPANGAKRFAMAADQQPGRIPAPGLAASPDAQQDLTPGDFTSPGVAMAPEAESDPLAAGKALDAAQARNGGEVEDAGSVVDVGADLSDKDTRWREAKASGKPPWELLHEQAQEVGAVDDIAARYGSPETWGDHFKAIEKKIAMAQKAAQRAKP